MKEAKDGRSGYGHKTDGCATGAPFHYMGQLLDPCMLYAQGYILDLLQRKGAFDQTLDEVRSDYQERFGLNLIWKCPISDDMRGGGTIIPVQEGFLHLPYSVVVHTLGARYDLKGAELLTIKEVRTLQSECKAYMDGLLSALGDMERVLQVRPARRYIDDQGDIYFVRAGIGDVYKGFRRYAEPKPGRRKEMGIRTLSYVDDIDRAQYDLDLYAQKHHLKVLEEGSPDMEPAQDDRNYRGEKP